MTVIFAERVLSDMASAQCREDAKGAVVTVTGEIDMISAPDLADLLSALLPESRKTLVVDLTRTSFFGVSGLAVLVEIRQAVKDRGAGLRILSRSRHTRGYLCLAGLASADDQALDGAAS
ncbi:STAS domain-containing protein [Amycolatopsis sp. H20-H5]|uniref:STAS domain-containing protein n=1 Tax=Amycolatopsis sp. H20-H5 TaxID=3046309 RepID=UPI002DBA7489|nr:STAS domain-containing protein [Amycolatopsis sp. H20-H5]MEC3975833.1 STAS domain-containing protein [Amycolatopsis sp. H20-H5]